MRRRVAAVAAVLAVVLLLVLADLGVLSGRIDRFPVRFAQAPGTTWVLVGSDSRAALPAGAATESFGDVQEVPGERADVVLVVHRTDDGRVTTLSVPRDLLVRRPSGAYEPLAHSLLDGPQQVVDTLCRTLGVRADHAVILDFAGFAELVDDLDGVPVDIPEPVRDPAAGLDLAAGPQRLDGAQALALIRSRHPEVLRDGQWRAVDERAGAETRTTQAGVVLAAVRDALLADPFSWPASAWSGVGSVRTDDGTGPWDLLQLVRSIGEVTPLPAAPLDGADRAVTVSADTWRTLAEAGLPGSPAALPTCG